jgi:hypothetical protein
VSVAIVTAIPVATVTVIVGHAQIVRKLAPSPARSNRSLRRPSCSIARTLTMGTRTSRETTRGRKRLPSPRQQTAVRRLQAVHPPDSVVAAAVAVVVPEHQHPRVEATNSVPK